MRTIWCAPIELIETIPVCDGGVSLCLSPPALLGVTPFPAVHLPYQPGRNSSFRLVVARPVILSATQMRGRAATLVFGMPYPRPRRTPCKSSLAGEAPIAYAFQQIAPAKVTIAHALVPSTWRDSRNLSNGVSTAATAKHGCAPWQASSR